MHLILAKKCFANFHAFRLKHTCRIKKNMKIKYRGPDVLVFRYLTIIYIITLLPLLLIFSTQKRQNVLKAILGRNNTVLIMLSMYVWYETKS